MNQKLKNVLIILSVYVGSVILALILAPIGGYLHINLLNAHCGGGLFLLEMGDKGCNYEGFIYFYIFWLAIFAFSLLKQKTAWAVYIIGTVLFWIGIILIIATENLRYLKNEDIGSLIIMICFFAVGWLLAQGGLLVYKKFKK
ncbi:MAG: hypothetical protein WCV70_01995 [Patescibacteria group bacterium]|jgi:hypothetical protein